jgi:hypothetical protein
MHKSANEESIYLVSYQKLLEMGVEFPSDRKYYKDRP